MDLFIQVKTPYTRVSKANGTSNLVILNTIRYHHHQDTPITHTRHYPNSTYITTILSPSPIPLPTVPNSNPHPNPYKCQPKTSTFLISAITTPSSFTMTGLPFSCLSFSSTKPLSAPLLIEALARANSLNGFTGSRYHGLEGVAEGRVVSCFRGLWEGATVDLGLVDEVPLVADSAGPAVAGGTMGLESRLPTAALPL